MKGVRPKKEKEKRENYKQVKKERTTVASSEPDFQYVRILLLVRLSVLTFLFSVFEFEIREIRGFAFGTARMAPSVKEFAGARFGHLSRHETEMLLLLCRVVVEVRLEFSSVLVEGESMAEGADMTIRGGERETTWDKAD